MLPGACAVALGLCTGDERSRLFVVVSHDCDLAERNFEKEPFVEVVEAVPVDACDPNLTHSKSTRLLHLQFSRDASMLNLELRAPSKHTIDKPRLEQFKPDDSFALSPENRAILGHWLAARYKRAAFPNTLLERLGNRISKAIGKLAAQNPHAILGIYLDHDPVDEIVDPEEPYGLLLYVVYSSEVDGSDDVAREVVTVLRQRFEREFLNENGIWTKIELQECEAVADTDITLASAKTLKIFRLDHVSLRESPAADLPDSG